MLFSQTAQPTKPNGSLQSSWISEVMKKPTQLSVQEAFNLSQGHVLNFYHFFSVSYLQYSSVPQIALFCCFALFLKGLIFHEARSLPYINSFSNVEICRGIAFPLGLY